MNRPTIVVLALVASAVIWVGIRQQRLASQIEAVQAENARLAAELARRPGISTAEFHEAARRLESAGEFMDAVEGRLTNVSTLLTRLQAASRQLNDPTGASRGPHGSEPSPRRAVRAGDWADRPTGGTSLPAIPASSHSPDGQLLQRSWGPEQVIGPPNTHTAGDISTAWAPRELRGGPDEWLNVSYERAVDISEIRVRETYNPGAIAKLAAVLPNGEEVVIWEGVTPPAEAPLDTAFSVPNGVHAQSVKIYLDRTRATGWNEIDAVELVGRDGSRQWATSATASSSFADR